MTNDRPLLLVILLLSTSVGCAGYQLGTRSLYRPEIRTVHVPVFRSDSLRRNLGERLTEAVVKEIELKTPYKVVGGLAADSVLSGQILTERKHVLVENLNDEPRHLEVDFVVHVTWIDRQGGAMLEPVVMPVPPLALRVGQAANFVPEAGQSIATAHQQVIQRMAQQIVAEMEIPW